MVQLEKERIKQALEQYKEIKGGGNKASAILGISPATISKVLNDKWETIADSMWRELKAKLGLGRNEWQVVETQAYNKMIEHLNDAKYSSQVIGVIGSAGSGKTQAIKHYAQSHAEVFNVSCSEYFSRKVFLSKLYQSMGGSPAGMNTPELVDAIADKLRVAEFPLIILDEADKLKDNVFQFLISLYNILEERCGMLLCATDYLERRMLRGVQNKRCGFAEVYSRMGDKFQYLPLPSLEDVALVCRANGLDDDELIIRVYEDCCTDIRRVKRILFAINKQK